MQRLNRGHGEGVEARLAALEGQHKQVEAEVNKDRQDFKDKIHEEASRTATGFENVKVS